MFSSEGKFRKTYRHQFNQLRTGDETEIPMSTLASRIETRKIPLTNGQIHAIKEAPDELVDIDGFQKIVGFQLFLNFFVAKSVMTRLFCKKMRATG